MWYVVESMRAITLFGKMLAFSRLRININDVEAIRQEIEQTLKIKTANNPIPVVIDSAVNLDLSALVEMLWSLNIQPIGIMAGQLDEQAIKLRLAIFPADGQRVESLKVEKTPNETASEPSAHTKTKNTPRGSVQNFGKELELGLTSSVCDGMLRSGQSLQHLGGDLVVLGGINNGAEAITDSNLHVYGRGLGRLVAGATGDKDARIFCQGFNPTLVSVAGTYCLHDDIPKEMIGKAVQVSYSEEQGLIFTLMSS